MLHSTFFVVVGYHTYTLSPKGFFFCILIWERLSRNIEPQLQGERTLFFFRVSVRRVSRFNRFTVTRTRKIKPLAPEIKTLNISRLTKKFISSVVSRHTCSCQTMYFQIEQIHYLRKIYSFKMQSFLRRRKKKETHSFPCRNSLWKSKLKLVADKPSVTTSMYWVRFQTFLFMDCRIFHFFSKLNFHKKIPFFKSFLTYPIAVDMVWIWNLSQV